MFTPNSTTTKSKTIGFVNVRVSDKSLPVTISVTDQGLFDALMADPTLFQRIVAKGQITVKSNERTPTGIDWATL